MDNQERDRNQEALSEIGHRCVICGSEANISLKVDGRKNHSCQNHLAEAEHLLRVGEEYFRGFSF